MFAFLSPPYIPFHLDTYTHTYTLLGPFAASLRGTPIGPDKSFIDDGLGDNPIDDSLLPPDCYK